MHTTVDYIKATGSQGRLKKSRLGLRLGFREGANALDYIILCRVLIDEFTR